MLQILRLTFLDFGMMSSGAKVSLSDLSFTVASLSLLTFFLVETSNVST